MNRISNKKDPLCAAINKINWKLLARQKQTLVNLCNRENCDDLDGILNMLDELQDAAEKAGYPVVFLTSDTPAYDDDAAPGPSSRT